MNVFKRTNFSKGCEGSLVYAEGILAGVLVYSVTAGIAYAWGKWAIPYLEDVLIPNAILKPILKSMCDCQKIEP